MYVGIDWASRAHELCVVDDEGAIVERFGFAHSERGISDALERLTKLGPPAELPVAIERPDGLLVGRLLEADHPVVPIHPNAFHAARPRWEGAGSKSDPGDAYRLADLLRTDHHRLRPLRPLERYPITDLDQAIAARLDQHAKTQLLRPLPRVGTISPGHLVAEVGPLLDRTATADEAAALCSASPITKRSGHQHAVCLRHASNTKARKALILWADNPRRASPWADQIYHQARPRGRRHPHAVRILARAWLRVISACSHTNTPYDPAPRRDRDRHLQPQTS